MFTELNGSGWKMETGLRSNTIAERKRSHFQDFALARRKCSVETREQPAPQPPPASISGGAGEGGVVEGSRVRGFEASRRICHSYGVSPLHKDKWPLEEQVNKSRALNHCLKSKYKSHLQVRFLFFSFLYQKPNPPTSELLSHR